MLPATRGFRVAALVAVAGVALHKARYVLGYGSGADHALASHGHAYLHLTTLLVGVVLALAVGQLVAVLARPSESSQAHRRRASLGRTWLAATAALLVVYGAQELAEGLLAAGHPTGLAALTAGGGAWAVPIAVVLGLAVALLARGADAAIAAASRRGPMLAAARPGRTRSHPLFAVHLIVEGVLGHNLAGRAPPPLGPV